ncbi:MAG: hypothetical protein ACLFUL_12160 [Desulfobacteraceae bacterium]
MGSVAKLDDLGTLKAEIIELISWAIDEETLPRREASFLEMEGDIVHFAGTCGEINGSKYFKISLEEVTEDTFNKRINNPNILGD